MLWSAIRLRASVTHCPGYRVCVCSCSSNSAIMNWSNEHLNAVWPGPDRTVLLHSECFILTLWYISWSFVFFCLFASDLQSEHRCSETAPGSDARPVFGLMDSNPAALAEQRRRAQKISEELMNTADGRRRDMLKKRLNEQKREREIMQRDHKEWVTKPIMTASRLWKTNTWKELVLVISTWYMVLLASDSELHQSFTVDCLQNVRRANLSLREAASAAGRMCGELAAQRQHETPARTRGAEHQEVRETRNR